MVCLWNIAFLSEQWWSTMINYVAWCNYGICRVLSQQNQLSVLCVLSNSTNLSVTQLCARRSPNFQTHPECVKKIKKGHVGHHPSSAWPTGIGAWPTPLKNDGVNLSWGDDIPNKWKHVPNHQPVYIYIYTLNLYKNNVHKIILIPYIHRHLNEIWYINNHH